MKNILLALMLVLSFACKKQDQIDALNAQVASLESQVSELSQLEGTITTLEATILSNTSTITDLEATIAQLELDATANAASIASLQATIDALNLTNGSLQTQLDSSNLAFNTYKGDLAAAVMIGEFPDYIYIGLSTVDSNMAIWDYGTGDGTGTPAYGLIDLRTIDLINIVATSGPLFGSGIQTYSEGTANGDGTYTFTSFYDEALGTSATGSWVFEEQTLNIKDIEKATALREQKRLNKVTGLLEMEYGFSAERAQEVTATISNWKRLSKTREMTSEEANAFAMEITGTDMDDVTEAYLNAQVGNDSLMNELVNNAAEMNGTSPEAISALLNSLN
jgi:hypothetical protein